jgi:hypothetical protein
MRTQTPYASGFGVGHGQHTFTRGIQVCAEPVRGLGTVVWMDTEGLFSSEDAQGAYGPKIFSLALLFSSVVLLNSVKAFNDQFFTFFIEQQRAARVLRQALLSEGLHSDMLIPGNLTIFWVLQQPVSYDASGETSRAQLDAFLSLPGDDTRTRVRNGFHHLVHEVPVATHDMRTWTRLHELAESDLAENYVSSTALLRNRILDELRHARPLQADGVAKQLQMYLQVVESKTLNGALAREALEEVEIGGICTNFSHLAESSAGPLPVESFHSAFVAARQAIEEHRIFMIETLHLGKEWSTKLEACLQDQMIKLEIRNAEAVLDTWQSITSDTAQGSCFFLNDLVVLLREFEANHSSAFKSVRKQAVDYATGLQRASLFDCFLMWDLLKPLTPWLVWPLCSLYLRSGLVSGCLALACHMAVIVTLYSILYTLQLLPCYLDLSYPVLRMHPLFVEVVIRAPPMLRWRVLALMVWRAGILHSAWRLLRCTLWRRRPSSEQQTDKQVDKLQLNLSVVASCSETLFRQQLSADVIHVATSLEAGDARMATLSLLKALHQIQDKSRESSTIASALGPLRVQQVSSSMQHFHFPGADAGQRALQECVNHNLAEVVARGSICELADTLLALLQALSQDESCKATSREIKCSSQAKPVRISQARWCKSSGPEVSLEPRSKVESPSCFATPEMESSHKVSADSTWFDDNQSSESLKSDSEGSCEAAQHHAKDADDCKARNGMCRWLGAGKSCSDTAKDERRVKFDADAKSDGFRLPATPFGYSRRHALRYEQELAATPVSPKSQLQETSDSSPTSNSVGSDLFELDADDDAESEARCRGFCCGKSALGLGESFAVCALALTIGFLGMSSTMSE